MDQKTFSILLEKYLRGDIAPEEVNILMDSLEDEDMRQQWEAAIGGVIAGGAGEMGGFDKNARDGDAPDKNARDRDVPYKNAPDKYLPNKRLYVYAAAATILALLATGILYFTRPQVVHKQIAKVTNPTPILPGGNKAMLTLADGSRITLDSAGNGAIAQQGNVQIVKLANGQLAYKAEKEGTTILHYNSLVTPKGGQYMIILPDGSKVWLNAATTLKYPTAFNGPAREVQLDGEAYFEIAANAGKPFLVKVNSSVVKVLGTHFNIMGYQDEENIRTTLLQGAVQVEHEDARIRLSPGEQAVLQKDKIMLKKDVDVEEVVAWKNGYFHFNHESLQGVMRQISRWYDVDVVYESRITEREFGGKIERGSSLNDVLKVLELSNVHYKIKERKIIITN